MWLGLGSHDEGGACGKGWGHMMREGHVMRRVMWLWLGSRDEGEPCDKEGHVVREGHMMREGHVIRKGRVMWKVQDKVWASDESE